MKFIRSCRTIALDGRRAIILFTLRGAARGPNDEME